MTKKIISLSVVLALVVICAISALVSCEKAATIEEDSNDVSGNLRVSVYEIEKTPFASLTRGVEPVANVCTRLSFAIYDMSGSRLKQINQTSDNTGFGQCAFQLDEGTYQLVVVGHSANGNPTMTNPEKIQFTNTTGYTDTFLCYSEVSIGEDPVDYEVSLDRIVALCRFVITDDIPAEVKKMQFYYTGGVSEKQFDLYTFLHEPSDGIAMKVTALDANGNELYNREFDVPMQQNHITWLSGAFFSGSSSSSTTITGVTVNTDWAGETHLTF